MPFYGWLRWLRASSFFCVSNRRCLQHDGLSIGFRQTGRGGVSSSLSCFFRFTWLCIRALDLEFLEVAQAAKYIGTRRLLVRVFFPVEFKLPHRSGHVAHVHGVPPVGIAGQQRMLTQKIDDSRNAFRTLVNLANRFRRKRDRVVRSGPGKPFEDIALCLFELQRREPPVAHDALPQLLHVRLAQFLLELQLPRQHNLDQLRTAHLGVQEHSYFLERRIAERLRFIDDDDRTVTHLMARLQPGHHGDYHLAQVLVTRNDFVIIDFEGEPGESLEQRHAKHSPLRDVAGMLRSFAYVHQSALRSMAVNEDEAARLAPLARAWEIETRTAFLSAYDAAAHGAALYEWLKPGAGLLGLFELEKALYELRYELGNRPSWAGIPLQGIADWGGAIGGSYAKH